MCRVNKFCNDFRCCRAGGLLVNLTESPVRSVLLVAPPVTGVSTGNETSVRRLAHGLESRGVRVIVCRPDT